MKNAARILIAEDDDAMRAFIAGTLRADGYEVLEARDGRELFWAIESCTRARGRPFDVVVSDLRMPSYDGLDVAEAWAAVDDRHPMVLMSAFPSAETHGRAERLGAVLLDKPFDVRRLQDEVRALLESAEKR